MFLLSCIYFIRLVDFIMRMEAWAKQLHFCLTSTTPHGLNGIKIRRLYYLLLHLLHPNIFSFNVKKEWQLSLFSIQLYPYIYIFVTSPLQRSSTMCRMTSWSSTYASINSIGYPNASPMAPPIYEPRILSCIVFIVPISLDVFLKIQVFLLQMCHQVQRLSHTSSMLQTHLEQYQYPFHSMWQGLPSP